MKYNNIVNARFIERKNRFTAEIEIDGRREICHVKNTGRLRELLLENAEIFVEKHDDSKRKTKYSLVCVKKDNELVNVDSLAPNKVFYEWVNEGGFLGGVRLVKPETTFGNSRFDCYMETENKKIFVEVKGVTLEENGTALFPDAPTQRGVKHLYELCACKKSGYEAYIVFVVQMKGVHTLSPNVKTQPEFAVALDECRKCGVGIVAVDCIVTESSLKIDKRINVVIPKKENVK